MIAPARISCARRVPALSRLPVAARDQSARNERSRPTKAPVARLAYAVGSSRAKVAANAKAIAKVSLRGRRRRRPDKKHISKTTIDQALIAGGWVTVIG